ncbi:MAG: hypothetical protein ACKV2T_24880 [Kofleriaceae bacterium]
MKTLAALTVVAALATLAAAKPAPQKRCSKTAFSQPIKFEGCLDGEAKKHCALYYFDMNGNYSYSGLEPAMKSGPYRLTGSRVTLSFTDDDGATKSFTLVLAKDHSVLGTMKRVP